jgi:hypothetical protein
LRSCAILVVEDGTEYSEAFRRLAGAGEKGIELLRAADAGEARRILQERKVDAIFLDLAFDRAPPDELVGDAGNLEERFAGDLARARRHLARYQGFYIAEALAELIPKDTPVVLAFDFSGDPGRLAALRQRLPRLEGIVDGTPISRVLERLRSVISDLV